MKTLNFVLTILLISVFNMSVAGQAHDHEKMNTPSSGTESFKVWGNCNMCKSRIEKAVKIEGVKNASWDSKTRMLTVNYDPSKTSKDALSKLVAAAGHDTEKYKAPDEIYAKLPGCCHYDRE